MISLIALGVLVVIAVSVTWRLSLVRYQAIRDRKKEVSMFGGLVKLLLWEPNEGLVILRNKSISDVIAGHGGGTRFIFPIKGDELRARIPLAFRMLTWEDQEVLTRESIQVRVKVALWWKVSDLPKYIFNIDTSVHVEDSHQNVGLLEAAEMWLRTLTESSLRTLVSQANVALLISSQATSYLHVGAAPQRETGATPHPAPGTPESLAHDLQAELAKQTADYGLEIQRVVVQEIGLSPEIQQAIDKVWKASLLPAQSEQEARARQIELQAVAQVLGVDTVGLNELLKNFQGSTFYAWPAFLESLFGKVARKTDAAPSLQPGAVPGQLPDQQLQLEDGKELKTYK